MEFHWIAVFSPAVLLACLGGAVLGIIWGAMPGLTVNMALALLVGITYSFPGDTAIAFLLSVWLAGEFGGAIPAVMINIPGTPAAVPTQMAGHPLALRGEGAPAIGAALLASVGGGLAGTLFLATTTPLLTLVILHVGSWEVFLLAILGIVVAGSLVDGQDSLRGWAMGLVGLLIAMVGQDAIHGVPRWTFERPELITGLGFLPVMVGLLVVSEAIDALARKGTELQQAPPSRLVFPWQIFQRYGRSIARSSLVGSLVGALPGAGANVAAFISYTLGERRSRRDFSHGDMEGVICGEVANNANVGGSLVPAMTLGIPGNNAAVLFIAALNLHGIVLGPTVQEDHPGLIEYVLAALLVANLALLVSAPLTVRLALRALAVPLKALMPIVIVLAVAGTYAASHSMWDVYVMFAAGIAGYVLKCGGFSLAPIVLGMILGPIADENLRRAMLLADGDIVTLLSRPVGMALLVALVATILFGLHRHLRQSR
jgi:putative tricarboxylic transport membrane protein